MSAESDSSHELEAVMEQNLKDTMALLARTPAALDALLRDLPEAWTLRMKGRARGALLTSWAI